MELRIAIMVDGGFFLERYRYIYGEGHSVEDVMKVFNTTISKHSAGNYLLRVFYYDCHPADKKVSAPISGLLIDFNQTPSAIFRKDLFEKLKRTRKVALRLGDLYSRDIWVIKQETLRKLLDGEIEIKSLKDKGFLLRF